MLKEVEISWQKEKEEVQMFQVIQACPAVLHGANLAGSFLAFSSLS